MEKVYMIPEDQYISMKNNKDDQEGGALLSTKSKDPPDVQMKLFHDEHSKNQARRWNKEAEDANKRIQPLLALHSSHIEEVIKNIPDNQRANANFVLQVLSRLPKVAIVRNYIAIEGEALREPASTIVQDIIANGVVNSQKIIEAMRKGKKRTAPASPRSNLPSLNETIDSRRGGTPADSTFESFSDEINPLVTSTPAASTPTASTPATSTPKPIIKRKRPNYPSSASPVKTRSTQPEITQPPATDPRRISKKKPTRTPRQILRFLRETPKQKPRENDDDDGKKRRPPWEAFD